MKDEYIKEIEFRGLGKRKVVVVLYVVVVVVEEDEVVEGVVLLVVEVVVGSLKIELVAKLLSLALTLFVLAVEASTELSGGNVGKSI